MPRRHAALLAVVVGLLGGLHLAVAWALERAVFPLLDVEHLSDRDRFEARALASPPPLTQASTALLRQELGGAPEDPEARARHLAAWVRARLRETPVMVDGVEGLLGPGPPRPAMCSGYSKLLAAGASALGHPTRVAWLDGHTVSEVWFDGPGWVLVDANGNLLFRTQDGGLASLLEVVDQPESVTAERLVSGPAGDDPDYLGTSRMEVFARNPIVVVIASEHLLDFHRRTRDPAVLLRHVVMGEPVARAWQYVGAERQPLGNKRGWLVGLLVLDLIVLVVLLALAIAWRRSRAVASGDSAA